jgi:hypothetical protein
MAYRSWLKDVKRLDDLAKFLHHFPRHHNDFDREWEIEKREFTELKDPFRPACLDKASYRFFEGCLHDGYVFGVEKTRDRIEISIQNSAIEVFCNDYFAETAQEVATVLSPVRLTFEGVNYANAVRTDPEGWLKWDDWSRWRPVENLSSTDTFLRGWFYEQDDKTQWVGHFQKWNGAESKLNGSIFILIDCERVAAKPESERALRKKVGDQCYDAMMFIESLPMEERWLSMGHLRQYLDEKGIPRRIIPLQSERERTSELEEN